MLRADAHVHFWDCAVVPLDWLARVPTLNRSFLPADLLRDQQPPADAWVFVEAGARDALAEAQWAHRLAQFEPRLRAVVAGLPLFDESERQRLLAAYRDLSLVRGVRWTLIGQPPGALRSRRLIEALLAVQAQGLAFDLNLEAAQLEDAVWLARQLPQLNFVLDHAGNPDLLPDAFSAWADSIAHFADCHNVACKLSGLVTRLAPDGSLAEQLSNLRPWVHHVIACFGSRRVMIGSDFPVITQRAACAWWVSFLEHELMQYSAEAQADMWAGTASHFYRFALSPLNTSERNSNL